MVPKRHPHHQTALEKSVYGLTEWNEAAIQQADLIANPGCYPTAVLLIFIAIIKGKFNRLNEYYYRCKKWRVRSR